MPCTRAVGDPKAELYQKVRSSLVVCGSGKDLTTVTIDLPVVESLPLVFCEQLAELGVSQRDCLV
jgi:hypothetical protein